ncbi:MAG: hypothetical protein J0M30_02665 [Chitinophagales bacterium]|nr:hypothetical protein [Chitinophagales bacterium]
MLKPPLASILIILLTLCALKPLASPQVPDYIIYKGDTMATYTLMLEQYFQLQEKPDHGSLFGLSFREGSSFSCWRGYQAIYKIENDSLFLVDIIGCGARSSGKINKLASVEKLKTLFKDKFLNERVFMYWVSNDIKFPLTNKVLRWDGVFYVIYEREKVISISNGIILKTEDVQNYINDPNRINRRDKSKISDLLFKKLKKAKWKNGYDYDCSEKYMITIDENGSVSKVRMLLSAEEIKESYDKNEYEYCINNILNALKSVKFDIIKDMGKPIAEEIYIEIWVEDNGKLENWTH